MCESIRYVKLNVTDPEVLQKFIDNLEELKILYNIKYIVLGSAILIRFPVYTVMFLYTDKYDKNIIAIGKNAEEQTLTEHDYKIFEKM